MVALRTLPHCHGLLVAHWLDGQASLAAEDVERAFADGPPTAPLWLHFDLLDGRAHHFLYALPGLPQAARDMLCDRNEATQFDAEGDAVWGTIPDFHHEVGDTPNPAQMGALHMAMTPMLLVTARRHPLRAFRVMGYERPTASTPAATWDRILRAVLDGMNRAAQALGDRLAAMEDGLLQNRTVAHDDLAEIRRSVLMLHRRIEPAAHRYMELAEVAPDWMGGAGHDPRRGAMRLEGVQRAVASLQERGRIAQDQLAARSAEESNRRLMVLSVLTAILLPPTLVTGFFGMNTTDLPGTSEPGGILWAVGAMLASISLAIGVLSYLGLLRWRRGRRS